MGVVVRTFTLPASTITIQRQQRTNNPNHHSSGRRRECNRNTEVVQKMISPDQIHDLVVASIPFPELTNHPFVLNGEEANMATTQWLADATTAIVTENKNSGGGWWQSYINVFKTILSFVHTTIDGPLKSVGIEQTWGISIFLFTACKLQELIKKCYDGCFVFDKVSLFWLCFISHRYYFHFFSFLSSLWIAYQ
jgi:hypothetical protein